jgi:hypothetical protein
MTDLRVKDWAMKRGDQLVAYGDRRPCERLYLTVTRVAKDGTWADIRVQTWAVMWTKRQQLAADGLPPASVLQPWGQSDMERQEVDHMAMLAERRTA